MRTPEINPPVAALHEHVVHSPNGQRADPYYWLRDDERANPEVLAYLAAENAYHACYCAPIKPLEDRLYAEIIGRLKQDDSTVPYRKQGYWYYIRFEPGKEHPIYARRKDSPHAPEQIMLDANELSLGHDYYQIGEAEVSPDGQWLAFCEDTVGRRRYALRFKNLNAGEIEPIRIEDVEPDVAWANDSRTVLYVEKDAETLLGLKVKKHILGADPAADSVVFEQTDTSLYTGVSKSKSDRFIFIHMEGTLSSEWRYAEAADPQLSFQTFLPRQNGHEYEIEHLDDRFIIRTNWQARNFRLMSVRLGRSGSTSEWRDLLAHQEDVFIEDFEVFRGFIAASARHGGLRKIAVLPLMGEHAEPSSSQATSPPAP